jgi:Fe2+ or Zn2+ uptake regulation protein
MRYNTYINNTKCIEWKLNANQGALFDLLNQLSSWAKDVVIDKKVYYHISRNKVIDEIPLFYSKSDTVYRHFKILNEKGLIEYLNIDGKDLIKLTTKGKEWNRNLSSEMNPKLGNESEETRIEIRDSSEMNPTYNNTIHNNTNNNISFDDFWNLYEKKVNKEKCEKKWNKLSDVDREIIMKYIPMYKKAQPEKKFRKNPETFLNNKSWNDELISDESKTQSPSFNSSGGFDNPKKTTDELEVGDWIVLKHRAGFDYKAKFFGFSEQGRMIIKDSYFTPEQLEIIK